VLDPLEHLMHVANLQRLFMGQSDESDEQIEIEDDKAIAN
jgi:hypothetical protein